MDGLNLLVVSVLSRAFVAGTPLLFGTLGEVYAERAGILNLGVEGMMSVGAVSAFGVAYTTGNPWLGLLAGGLAAALLALIHAFATIHLKANQIVSGLALTMFGIGLSGLLGKAYIGMPLPCKFSTVSVPCLCKIPILGPSLFSRDPLLYLSVPLTVFLWFLLYKTRWGISIRSVGENPAASDAMGVNVYRVQYLCVIAGGFLSGFAGAYLSLAYIPSWIEGMVGGRGWIVIALTIFAGWNPIRAFIGAYLFGGIYVLQYLLQPLGISPNILMMLPYITTLFVLFLGASESLKKKMGSPASLGVAYKRGEK